jgi:hypothetical protein
MARCTASLLAKSVSVDAFTHSLTAIEIAENLSIEAPEAPSASEEAPHLISPFAWVFVALFLRDDIAIPEDLIGRLTILSPKGRAFPGPEQRIDLATASNARSLVLIPAFPFTGNGIYRLRYEIRCGDEWRFAAECPLPLTIRARTTDNPGTGV